MFDPTLPADGGDFEAWLAGELRRPASPDGARTSRIMARVRRSAPPARRRSRWAPPALGLAVAASLAGLAALHPLALAARPGATGGLARMTGAPYGDTLAAAIGIVLRDTIRDTMEVAVRDTMRLVCSAPGRHRYALVADDTRWVGHPPGAHTAAPPALPARALPDTTN